MKIKNILTIAAILMVEIINAQNKTIVHTITYNELLNKREILFKEDSSNLEKIIKEHFSFLFIITNAPDSAKQNIRIAENAPDSVSTDSKTFFYDLTSFIIKQHEQHKGFETKVKFKGTEITKIAFNLVDTIPSSDKPKDSNESELATTLNAQKGSNDENNSSVVKHKGKQKGKIRCKSCDKADADTYILDMCQTENCLGKRRPMMLVGHDCKSCLDKCRNYKFRIRHDYLLSFLIINNNPFRYDLEVNYNPVAFNTDHGDFDGLISKLTVAPQENKSTAVSGSSENSTSDSAKKAQAVKKFTENKNELEGILKDIDVFAGAVKEYLLQLQSRECVDQAEVDSMIKIFGLRYKMIFGDESPEDFFKKKIDALKKIDGTTPEQKASISVLEERVSKAVLKPVEEIKKSISELIGKQYNFSLLPIQITNDNADVVEINIARKNKQTNATDKYTYQFYVRGGLKIDFSAGAFLSFLVDHNYTTEDVSVTLKDISGADSIITTKYIRQQQLDHFNFMLGSLMHVHYRQANYINATLNFGAALNADQKAQMLAGASLIFGRQQRFIFNAEFAFGSVKRLSAPYQVDGILKGDQVPTVDRRLTGFAIGFTYNLIKPKVAQ